jgi:DNA ligase (NAD+)
MTKLERADELVDFLNENTKLYNQGTPRITDEEWDKAYFELDSLEKELGIARTDSPTQNIAYEVVTKLEKVTHSSPMLSLNKTKDWSEFLRYFGDKDVVGMVKLDGLTCRLTYDKNGFLESAETRGNGEVGEDILHNAKVIKSIPKRIGYYGGLVVDGEVICTEDEFVPFSTEYKNPRNFAAGSIRLLDSKECAKRHLTFVAWNVVEGLEGNSFLDKLERLTDFGFIIVPYTSSFDWDAKEFLQNQAKEDGYPIDGLVGRFDDIEYGTSLGSTAHHANAAYAFKFYDEEYESTLQDIEWGMSRLGQLTPVAVFDEIEIEGSLVSRANLSNISILRETLGETPYQGEKVWVTKRNAIIPKIERAEKRESADPLSIPLVCPICGSETEVVESDSGTLNLVCTNPACEGKLVNHIDHFAGKKGLDIKGLSVATLEKLIDWGWINCLSDIFSLADHRDEWIKKPSFGAKSVDKILSAIEDSKSTTLEAFITSLGIPLIGRTVAKELCKHIKSYEEFREKVNSKFDFSKYDGFGPEKVDALWNYDYSEADKIYPLLRIAETEVNSAEQSCEGMTICITGKLKQFKNRDALKTWIEERGGKVTGSVTKNTTYLINNDIASTSSKNVSAKQLDIPIVTEQEFMEVINHVMP